MVQITMDSATVHLRFEVKDFDSWWSSFRAHADEHRALGLASEALYRDAEPHATNHDGDRP